MRLFNTARNENPARGLPRKLAFQVSACARFIAALLRVRPRIVHVKAATGINFFQHGLYAALARLFGRKVLLHLHAGDFPAFVLRLRNPLEGLLETRPLGDCTVVLAERRAAHKVS